jgi:hypothetical protein
MPRPRGYNELDLPRDGSDPEPPAHVPGPKRAHASSAPPTLDPRTLWRTIASHVLALDSVHALRSSHWSWTEHADLDSGTRHEHARIEADSASIDVTFTSRLSDTHAGPIEVDRVESLVARVCVRVVVEITRRPPVRPVVTVGPAELEATIALALPPATPRRRQRRVIAT